MAKRLRVVRQMKCLLREKIHMERAWAGWGAGERQTERECHVLWEWFKSLMWGSPSRLMPSHLALSGLEPHIWPDSGPSPFCTSIFYPRRILRKSQGLVKSKATRLHSDTRKKIFVLKGWL